MRRIAPLALLGTFALVLAAAVALVPAGCDNIGEQGCTLIGCQDQLTVTFGHLVALPYDVKLTLDGKTATFTCDGTGVKSPAGTSVQRCDGEGFVLLATPAMVDVSVTCGVAPDDGGISRCGTSAQPTYKTTQPNGPNCEPTCRQATVTVP